MLSVCLFGQDVITEVMMAALERNDPNVTITDKISPRSAHISIAGGQYMLVWGGYTEVAVGERYLNPAEVNIYHLEHKYWTKHVCDGDIPPGTSGAVASYEPGSEHMLLFGGHTAQGNSNLLFRLDLKTFRWTNLSPDDPDQLARWPSPRDKFCAWSYKHKLFCFGGFGLPIERYLNENGSFVIDSTTHSPDVRGWNNQLLVYDEKTRKWSNPKCKGTVPLARAAMATFKLGEKVYLFGGRHMDKRMNDLHCFNLEDYSWSGELVTEGATPCGRSWHSLTAVSHDTAFLYGGYSTEGTPLSDAWQLNVRRRQWTQMTVPAGIRKCRLWHTGCCSPEGEVLIFGGCCSDLLDYTNVDFQQHSNKVLSFHTKPLSLRSLCLQAAYKNKSQLQDYWFTLPRDLADWLHRQSQVEKIKSNTPASGLQKQGSTCVVS